MATTTSVMALTKPSTTDPALIGDINSNMDIIDSWAVASAATNQAVGDAATAGSTAQFARTDHKHGMPNFGAPVSVTTANGNGVATTIARSDHAHKIADGAINSNAMFASGCIPSARVRHSAAQTIPDNNSTSLAFDTDRWDTEAIHDTATNNSRLTCVTAGKYTITAHVTFAATSDVGNRAAYLIVNGATTIGGQLIRAADSDVTKIIVGTEWPLAASDYVEVLAYQNSGGDLLVVAGLANDGSLCDFGMTWQAP